MYLPSLLAMCPFHSHAVVRTNMFGGPAPQAHVAVIAQERNAHGAVAAATAAIAARG